jgi:hypothetical protein
MSTSFFLNLVLAIISRTVDHIFFFCRFSLILSVVFRAGLARTEVVQMYHGEVTDKCPMHKMFAQTQHWNADTAAGKETELVIERRTLPSVYDQPF